MLIAVMRLQLLTGKRLGRLPMDLIQFQMMGYAELDEVIPRAVILNAASMQTVLAFVSKIVRRSPF